MTEQLSSAAVNTATLRAFPLPLAEASLSRALGVSHTRTAPIGGVRLPPAGKVRARSTPALPDSEVHSVHLST